MSVFLFVLFCFNLKTNRLNKNITNLVSQCSLSLVEIGDFFIFTQIIMPYRVFNIKDSMKIVTKSRKIRQRNKNRMPISSY